MHCIWELSGICFCTVPGQKTLTAPATSCYTNGSFPPLIPWFKLQRCEHLVLPWLNMLSNRQIEQQTFLKPIIFVLPGTMLFFFCFNSDAHINLHSCFGTIPCTQAWTPSGIYRLNEIYKTRVLPTRYTCFCITVMCQKYVKMLKWNGKKRWTKRNLRCYCSQIRAIFGSYQRSSVWLHRTTPEHYKKPTLRHAWLLHWFVWFANDAHVMVLVIWCKSQNALI